MVDKKAKATERLNGLLTGSWLVNRELELNHFFLIVKRTASFQEALFICREIILFIFIYLLILYRERKGEKERENNIDLLFCSFMHSLFDSCMWDKTHNFGILGQPYNRLSYPLVQGLQENDVK